MDPEGYLVSAQRGSSTDGLRTDDKSHTVIEPEIPENPASIEEDEIEYDEPDVEDDIEDVGVESENGADSGNTEMVPISKAKGATAVKSSLWVASQRIFLFLLVLYFLDLDIEYKKTSAEIGYCDPGKETNAVLEHLRENRLSIEACSTANITQLFSASGDLISCLSSQGISLPIPDTCTPCPEHGSCKGRNISCDTGYVLRSHSIFFNLPTVGDRSNVTLSSSSPIEGIWKIISIFLDGQPGLGSVAFPPSCIRDPSRQKKIGLLGKGISAILGQERGKRVCSGMTPDNLTEKEGGDARRWGFDLEALKASMREDAAVCSFYNQYFIYIISL